jgi:UDP:flavonoid glycosyltransferase YjiC (YdhE family)
MTSSLKFMLSSIGTLGDMLPILTLGQELMERGHACHMSPGSSTIGARER